MLLRFKNLPSVGHLGIKKKQLPYFGCGNSHYFVEFSSVLLRFKILPSVEK